MNLRQRLASQGDRPRDRARLARARRCGGPGRARDVHGGVAARRRAADARARPGDRRRLLAGRRGAARAAHRTRPARRSASTRVPSPSRSPASATCGSTAEPIPLFAPLSGFWRAADGWVRTHANYPHHRARLLAALDLPDTGDDADLVDRLSAGGRASAPAVDVQETGLRRGRARRRRRPARGARRAAGHGRHGSARGTVAWPRHALPAQDVRVLDLTRVLAGPVATRTLGAARRGRAAGRRPWLPEADGTHIDTGFGKRSTRLALDDAADRATFEELLDTADVVVTGYRPGALDRHGLERRRAARPPARPGRGRALRVGRHGPVGRAARVRQPGPGRHGDLRSIEGTATAGPVPCPPRRSTTARATCSPRRSCARSPTGRSPAPASTCGCRWRGPRPGCSAARRSAARRRGPRPTRTPDRWLAETDSPYGRAPARPVPARRRGRRDRLDPTTAPVGHGRAPVGDAIEEDAHERPVRRPSRSTSPGPSSIASLFGSVDRPSREEQPPTDKRSVQERRVEVLQLLDTLPEPRWTERDTDCGDLDAVRLAAAARPGSQVVRFGPRPSAFVLVPMRTCGRLLARMTISLAFWKAASISTCTPPHLAARWTNVFGRGLSRTRSPVTLMNLFTKLRSGHVPAMKRFSRLDRDSWTRLSRHFVILEDPDSRFRGSSLGCRQVFGATQPPPRHSTASPLA